jgi:hypothetical protein
VSDRWVLSSLSRLSTQGARNHLIRRVCRASLRVTASPARSRHENKIVINRCLTVKCHSKEPITPASLRDLGRGGPGCGAATA